MIVASMTAIGTSAARDRCSRVNLIDSRAARTALKIIRSSEWLKTAPERVRAMISAVRRTGRQHGR